MKTSSVTKSQLLSAIAQLQGVAIGSINTLTVPVLTGGKKNPMQGRITKETFNGNVLFACNINGNTYMNMVKKRLAQEGKDPESFVLGALPWGERIQNTPFITNKGEIYVQVSYLHPPKEIIYRFCGHIIDKADIIGLKESSNGEQGGLDNKVPVRTPKLSSIVGLKMGKLSVNMI
jgi:hypothetical protein